MHPIARSGFAKQVDAYEAARPPYPPAAVSRIVSLVAGLGAQPGRPEGQQLRLVDLASGTGKLTRLLAAHLLPESCLVQAVEPVPEMRAAFRRILPSIACHDGTASSMPFPDGSIDVVTVAQAFHWFAEIDTLRELARVLRPDGLLVLIWNLEDADPDRSDWVARLRDIYERHERNTPQYRLGLWKDVWSKPVAARLFAVPPLHHERLTWEMFVPKSQVWERILSKSYIACLPAGDKERLKAEVEGAMASVVEGPAGVPYPHYTDVFWTYRRAA